MTSYLTSMDNISLSRTVSRYSTSKFLGFDLDFDPWRSSGVEKNSTVWKPIYDFLFDFYGQKSLYLVPFSRYSTSKFLGFDLDFDPWWSSGVETIYTIRKPIYDFLFDFYEQHLSISYRFRDIRLQSF